MDASAITTGLSIFATAFDLSRSARELTKEAAVAAALIELQDKMLAAQAFTQNVLKENDEIQRQLVQMLDWQETTSRYELCELAPGILVYRQKVGLSDPQPAHHLCPHCFLQRKQSILQAKRVGGPTYHCHQCQADFPTQPPEPPFIAMTGRRGY